MHLVGFIIRVCHDAHIYIFFPQKLDSIYIGKWISETWLMAVPHTLLYSALFLCPGDVILCCIVSLVRSSEEQCQFSANSLEY